MINKRAQALAGIYNAWVGQATLNSRYSFGVAAKFRLNKRIKELEFSNPTILTISLTE